MPTVTRLSPASGPAAGGTLVVVSGEDFNLTSEVTVGGTPVTAQLISHTEIHLTTPAHAPGTVHVVVTAANSRSHQGHASEFTFLSPPVVEGISADNGWDSPDAHLTIHGTNLAGVTSVTFNGRPSLGFTVNADGAIAAQRPYSPAGSTAVVVTTTGGSSGPYGVWFPPDKSQLATFITQLVYLVLLIGGLIAYLTWSGFKNGLPNPLGGIVPLSVPWAGALGAVMLSVTGLTEHRNEWDRAYIYWHLSRPLIGAIVGTFAYLIVASGVVASGGSPSGNLTATAGFHVTNLFYDVLAFLVGYREETFRNLLQKFSDVLFGPGETDKTTTTKGSTTPTSGSPPPPPPGPTTQTHSVLE